MEIHEADSAGFARRLEAVCAALGIAVIGFLVWLLRFAVPGSRGPAWINALPASDAFFNGASACCACAGLLAIRRGRRSLHRALMLVALMCSAAFLVGYIAFHKFRGETRFAGTGWVRTAYLFLLASHVALSFVVLPLLLTTIAFAGFGIFERHKRLARWTLPLWLYVSLTGVAVYFFLKTSY